MARKRKVTTTKIEEIPEEIDDFAEVAADALPPGVETALKEIGADVLRCVLYRRLKGQKQAYCGTLDADEFTMEEVAARFGGGRYLVRFVGSEGTIKGATFYIDEALKPRKVIPEDEHGGVAGSLMERLLDRMMERPAQKDPMEIAAALAAASAAQMQNNLALLTPLLDKLMAGKAAGGGAADILAAVELGISLGGKDSDGIVPVLRDVGVPLVRALEQHFSKPGAAPGDGGAVTPIGNPGGAPAWVEAVRPYVDLFVEYAARGDDPALWAGVVDAQYPKFARWLETAVVQPNFEKGLIHYFPALAPHLAWVRAFLDEFVAEEVEDKPAGEIVQEDETDE